MTASIWNPEIQGNVHAYEEKHIVAVNGQTVFYLTSFTYVQGSLALMVFRNGQLMTHPDDYIESSSSSITFTSTELHAGEEIYIIGNSYAVAGYDVTLRGDLAALGGAALVGFTPTGTIAATTVQAAIAETASESVAALAAKANKGTNADIFQLTAVAPSLTNAAQTITIPALPTPTGTSNPALKYEPDIVMAGGQAGFGKWRQYHNAAEWGWGIVYNVPIDPYSVYPPDKLHVRDTANTNKGVCVAQRFDVAEGTSGANFWAIEWAPSSATATAPDWVWGPSMYFYEGSKVADYGVPGSAGGTLRIVSSADRESAIVLDSNVTAAPNSFLMRSTCVGGTIGWALQDVSAFNWATGPMPKTADGINRILVGVGADTVTGTTDVIKVYGQLKVFDLGASKGTISCVGNVGFNGLAPLADASRHTGADATDLASAITLVNQLKAILNNCGISLV